MRIALVGMLVGMCGCFAPAEEPEKWVDAGKPGAAYVCSPSTCTGCCEGNWCRAGNRDEACGNGGERCGACDVDALCGASRSCESLDPNRYGSGGTAGGDMPERGKGQTCGYIGNKWICW